MQTLTTQLVMRAAALGCLLLGLVWLAFARAGTAHADTTVTDCTGTGLANAMNLGSGVITFSCGPNPVIIDVNVQAGGLNVLAGQFFVIDGNNMITLSGANTNRIFDVRTNGSLILQNITLTDGRSFSDGGGNLPDLGGAILDEGDLLNLFNVVIRNSVSQTAGGGIKIITGSVLIQDSLIEGNQSGLGGGIDNGGPLSNQASTLNLVNTTVRSNHAITASGGGLNLRGTVIISGSQIVNNHADNAFGGGIQGVAGELTLYRTVLSGNNANIGGGISNDFNHTLTLHDSTLSTNMANVKGGGIYIGGLATLNDSTLSANTALLGAGIYVGGASLVHVNHSTLSGNSSNQGGGIDNEGRTTLNNSTLSANTAAQLGGGIYNATLSTSTLVSSTLSGNAASSGGGIFNDVDVTSSSLDSSTLSGNQASQQGGGIYNGANSTATLNNSTLSGNRAAQRGGGIYNQALASLYNVTVSGNAAGAGGALFMDSGHTTVLSNTILAYSPQGGNCNGTVSFSKYSISSDNSCNLPGWPERLNPNHLDPLLTGLGNYGGPTQVHMLKSNSPAIDAVLGNNAPLIDQRGLPRPGPDGSFDIGAVEWQSGETSLAPHLYSPLSER